MTDTARPSEILAPAGYLDHFSAAEFKFRWQEALMAERSKWRRAPELFTASVLVYFMDQNGLCFPSVELLAATMRKSQDTVRRTLRSLASNGWLVIQHRPNKTSLYQALLPDYALHRLLEIRKRKTEPSPMLVHRDTVDRVIDEVCAWFGFDRPRLESFPEHSRLVGRLFQITQRITGGESHVDMLIKFMCEDPPENIHSPHGFLMSRASEFARAYGAVGSGRKTASADDAAAFDAAVRQAVVAFRARSKKSPDRA